MFWRCSGRNSKLTAPRGLTRLGISNFLECNFVLKFSDTYQRRDHHVFGRSLHPRFCPDRFCR
jgi:hypothetical protein